MSTPFQAQGTLGLPGAPGLPLFNIPFGIVSSYDSKVEFELDLVGEGVRYVDLYGNALAQPANNFEQPAGAKCVLVIYDFKDGAPEIGVSFVGGFVDKDPRGQQAVSYLQGGMAVPGTVMDRSAGVSISTGGFLFLGSPRPEQGPSSLAIVHRDSCHVRVLILG